MVCHVSAGSLEVREGVPCYGAGFTGGCVSPEDGAGSQTLRSSARAERALNQLVISSALPPFKIVVSTRVFTVTYG